MIKKRKGRVTQGKSPLKVVYVRTSDEDKEANKGKRQYIIAITRGASQANLPSNGTMKRKMVEMLVVYKTDGSVSMKTPD